MKTTSTVPCTDAARRMALATATGSVLIGLPYATRLLGAVEAEVDHWGWIAIGLGGALLLLAWSVRRGRVLPACLAALASGEGAAAALQVPPALLWVLFHGQPISDGSPPGGLVAHWAFALPHIAVAALALAALCGLLRRRPAAAPMFADVLQAHESEAKTRD